MVAVSKIKNSSTTLSDRNVVSTCITNIGIDIEVALNTKRLFIPKKLNTVYEKKYKKMKKLRK